MYFISDFCHLCLQDDKCLVDLSQAAPENTVITSKLNVCISEVEWTALRHLLICRICIQKLELAYDFKQTCMKSVNILQNHLTLLKKNEKSKRVKAKLNVTLSRDSISHNIINEYAKNLNIVPKYGMLNQMLDRTVYAPATGFIITNGQQISYQNIFLNFVSGNPVYTPPANTNQIFVGNQNVAGNVASSENFSSAGNDAILKQLLETKNSEEVSVEIDPSLYNFEHFLVSKPTPAPKIECNECLQPFPTIKLLRQHFDSVHGGILPFSCTYCFSKFLLKDHYDKHMRNHKENNADTLLGSTINLDNISKSSNIRICANSIDNTEFKCSHCSKICESASNLEKHEIQFHDGYKPKTYFVKGMKAATCNLCKRDFSTEYYLEQHMKLHRRKTSNAGKTKNSKEDDVCILIDEKDELNNLPISTDRDVNDGSNKSVIDLTGEINNKSDDKALENNNLEANTESVDTEISAHAAANDSHLNEFIIESADGKPVCSFCKKSFCRRYDLKRHINNLHIKSINYACHMCDEIFYEGFHLTRHLRNHYSSLSCSDCRRLFTSVPEITNHMLVTHEQLKNIDCNVCYNSFNDLEVLKSHMEQHLLEIVYICHLCNEKFGECRELTKHVSEHNGMKSCDNCHRTFYEDDALLLHKETCFEEWHKCEVCPRVFKKRRNLRSHIKAKHSMEICVDEPEKKKLKTDDI